MILVLQYSKYYYTGKAVSKWICIPPVVLWWYILRSELLHHGAWAYFEGFWYRRKNDGSELERSKQNQKRALSIIKEAAKGIKEEVEAIQYPKQDYKWENIEETIT